nr:deleted in malignant brain tumors 1 protein [Pomacea canaliculata]
MLNWTGEPIDQKWTARHSVTMATMFLLCALALITKASGQGCGGIFTASSGIISSPSYPNQYQNNLDCGYLLIGPVGSRVTVSVSVFNLEAATGCSADYLQFRDGSSQTSPHIATYCGTAVPPVVRSFSNIMYIVFHTDYSVTGYGFRATFSISVIPQQFMLIANTGLRAIQRIDMATISNIVLPMSGLLNPVAVDFDPITNRVYWSDVAERTIRSANLDGSNVRLVFNFGTGAVPDGLAVDYLSGLLMYTDAGNCLIGMVTLTTNKYKSIIKTAIEKPRDIELDKRNGVMYWTDWGSTPKIERANYDGTNRKTLVSGSQYIVWPNGLALDTAGGRLYWADGYTDKIGWTTLDGTLTTVTFYNPGSTFFGLDYFQSNLYITDWGTAGNLATTTYIQQIAANGFSGRTMAQTNGRMNDIVIVAEQYIDKAPNVCTVNNGGCGSALICVPAGATTRKCLSPDAYVYLFRKRRSASQTENDAFVVRRVERSAEEFTDDTFVEGVVGKSFNNDTIGSLKIGE